MSTEAGDVQVEYTRIIQCEKPVLKGPELYDIAQRERELFETPTAGPNRGLCEG